MDNPPAQLTRESLRTWLAKLHDPSPFYDAIFDWYDEQLTIPRPSQVDTDPDKLFVRVDRAMAQAIKVEDAGDAEEGTTVGFEAYCRVDVPIAIALETMLFFCGKPVGKDQGDTYPFDTVFSQSHCTLEKRWGDGNYVWRTAQIGGGAVQDVRDENVVLLRGNAADGFVLFTSFTGPAGDTTTTTQCMIGMLRSLSANSTEYRQYLQRNGQSYKIFGLDFGRKTYGFNAARVRQVEKPLAAAMVELKTTGKIKENRPKGRRLS
jgi:hypothetical protein